MTCNQGTNGINILLPSLIAFLVFFASLLSSVAGPASVTRGLPQKMDQKAVRDETTLAEPSFFLSGG
jgi:hypothetical protein